MEEHQLEGLWSYIANEVGGVEQSQEQVARMGKLVLLPGNYLPGWNGLWAAVTYGYDGGIWSEKQVKANCRHIILGTDRDPEVLASDFYLWAGGRFRIAALKSPKEIDLEQFWRGSVLPSSVQLGVCSINGKVLTLCLAGTGRLRPVTFSSREQPYQSLGRLVKQMRSEQNAAPDPPRD